MAETKTKIERNRKYLLVRYGRMQHSGLFEHRLSEVPRREKKVVVKTDRGLELGEIVGALSLYKGSYSKYDTDELKKYFHESEIDFPTEPIGRVVRLASHEDESEQTHLESIAKEEMEFGQKVADELKLEMNIIDAEHIFGGERIIFYFLADGRVDFRELVKRLAHEYQTRIEMRQIGARDEAKIFGDYETCGQHICCQRFLHVLKPVNMRMAKLQKATLDPSKISGYCGRLKCCLRYEDENYTQLAKKLPKRNMQVQTPHGQGKVIETQVLTQLVFVQHTDGVRAAFALEDIKVLPREKKQNQRKGPKQNDQKQQGDSKKQNNRGRNDNRRNKKNDKNNNEKSERKNGSSENKQQDTQKEE